jgi:hypothetical protein
MYHGGWSQTKVPPFKHGRLAAGRAITQLDPVAREVLRVGLYELMDLELADHAIGSHVEVVKVLKSPHLAGFVNGADLALFSSSVIVIRQAFKVDVN